jgi:hypothetical protein
MQEDGVDVVLDGLDIHAVCGVLKMYIRELRVPCFGSVSFAALGGPIKAPSNVWVLAAADHLSTLSEPQQAFVRNLFLLLSCVEKRSQVNKMTATNLAIRYAAVCMWGWTVSHCNRSVWVLI